MEADRLYNWLELFTALYGREVLRGMLPVEVFLRSHPLEAKDSRETMENVTKLCQSLKHMLKMRRRISRLYEKKVSKGTLEEMRELDQDLRATVARIQRRIMRIYDLKGIALSTVGPNEPKQPVREGLKKAWTNMMDFLESEKMRSTYLSGKAMFKLDAHRENHIQARIREIMERPPKI